MTEIMREMDQKHSAINIVLHVLLFCWHFYHSTSPASSICLTSCWQVAFCCFYGEIMLDIIDRAEVEHSMPMISGLVIDSNICVKPSIEICGFKVPVAVQK